jgi:hypothetical protein
MFGAKSREIAQTKAALAAKSAKKLKWIFCVINNQIITI